MKNGGGVEPGAFLEWFFLKPVRLQAFEGQISRSDLQVLIREAGRVFSTFGVLKLSVAKYAEMGLLTPVLMSQKPGAGSLTIALRASRPSSPAGAARSAAADLGKRGKHISSVFS